MSNVKTLMWILNENKNLKKENEKLKIKNDELNREVQDYIHMMKINQMEYEERYDELDKKFEELKNEKRLLKIEIDIKNKILYEKDRLIKLLESRK